MHVLSIIFRNFAKHRLFFLVSTLSLSLAMTIAMLLMTHINFEKSYDKFYKDTDNIYRINYHVTKNGEQLINTCRTQSALGFVLNSESELLAAAGRAYYEDCYMYTEDVKLHGQQVVWADSSFINVFQHEMILGDANTALANHYSVVISDVIARKYFGSQNPIGKVIKLNEGIPFNVTGVFKAMPANTHMYYDFMVSFCTLEHWGNNMRSGNWNRVFPVTYIRKKPTVSEVQIQTLLQGLADKYLVDNKGEGEEFSYSIMPVKDIYLNSTQEREFRPQGNLMKINLLFLVAIFIVIIAWANNINVFTALSFERLKDACVRKINGAKNTNLFSYHIKESFVVNFVAVVLSIITIVLVFPFYKQLVANQVDAQVFTQFWFWAVFLVFLLVGTVVTTFISMLIYSSFKPLHVLNNSLNPNIRFGVVRHALVVFQFVLAILLISSTILIYRQIIFLENSDLGMNPEQVLVLRAPATNNTTGPKRYQDFCSFRDELLQHAQIKSVTATMNIPGQFNRNADNVINYKGLPVDVLFDISSVDDNFFKTFQVPILAGRNFHNNIENEKNNIIINERAAQVLGFAKPQDALGEQLKYRQFDLEIVGVVKNFHHESLQKEIGPYIYQFVHPKEFGYYPVQVQNRNIEALTETIEKVWYKHYPDAQIESFFLDAYFNKQYLSYRQMAVLAGVSAIFALLIACLGLIALASFAVKKRIKEIGIRKVNGASVLEILIMLNASFIKWVFIAFIVAVPIAYYFTSKWLQNFAYKTELSWWIFALAGAIVLLIAFITVSVQSLRAATCNPTEALKNE